MTRKRRDHHIGNCPVCSEELVVTGLACDACRTQLNGRFTRCPFCRLTVEQLDFIMVFLDCRGSIRDVEKELNISYPTVRNRLEEVRIVLGFQSREQADKQSGSRRDVLEAISQGEISPKDALKLLGAERDRLKKDSQ